MAGDLLAQLKLAKSEAERTWIITSQLLETLPLNVAKATLAAGVPHWFNTAIVGVLLEIDVSEAEALYRQITELSFTETFGTLGSSLHELTRKGIVAHFISKDRQLLSMYSGRIYKYLCQFDDLQHVAEANYHLLIIDKVKGIKDFKDQMTNYRRSSGFSAANNLVRNARELVELNLLNDKDSAEIDLEDYLMGWSAVRKSKQEKAPEKAREYLTIAARVFDNSINVSGSNDVETTALQNKVGLLPREFLDNKLAVAKRSGDIFRQKIWLGEIGNIYLEDGSYKDALSHFDSALEIDSSDVRSIVGHGIAYRLMGDYPAALTDFDRAVALDESNARAIASRGETYHLMGNYPAALADFDRAVALDESSAWAIASRGETYRLMGN
ncbi:MAG: tetratricopeptide repeat protein, partial [Methylococcaceae bacterium]